MRLHLSPGPVFKFECLTTSRRWTNFAGRAVFIGLLLAVLGFVVWFIERNNAMRQRPVDLVTAGEIFFCSIASTQLCLLFLMAPAVAADSICLDKARGALLPLMTTQLTSYEIVMGKFSARCLPILGYVICGLPVMAICLLMGGIHPEVIFGALLVCCGVALVGGSAAVLLSVLCSKTYEVILVCYLSWIVFLLLFPIEIILPTWATASLAGTFIPDFIKYSNPFYLCLAPYTSPGSVDMVDFVYYLLGCLGVSAFFLVVATFALRRVVIRQGAVTNKKVRRRWWTRRRPLFRLPGPSLDSNPVLWREWHRQRPSRWVRGVWNVYGFIAVAASLYCFLHSLFSQDRFQREVGIIVNAFQVSVGLLLVSVSGVTSLQDERVRGSLDVLLTTPIPSHQVYWGKWWGCFRMILRLTILPTLVASGAFVRSWFEGGHNLAFEYDRAGYFALMPLIVCCYGAWIVSVGLALGVWIQRPGRAMAASVTVFILFTVGLMFTMAFRNGPDEVFPAMGSCFLAPLMLTIECLDLSAGSRDFFIPGLLIWCILYAVASALLSALACATLDRRMSRMSERMARRHRPEKAVRRMLRMERTSAAT
jgi:ABC-type transport system involved in multi-copper enzyme maturation permease subunit